MGRVDPPPPRARDDRRDSAEHIRGISVPVPRRKPNLVIDVETNAWAYTEDDA